MHTQRPTKPVISAIIPIAGFPNGTKQIEEWISNPDLQNYELILIIDTDDHRTRIQTQAIAAKLSKITRVSVLESKSRNPGESRNIGLSSAQGAWIVFWDCDDVPNPSKVLEMITQADQSSAEIVIGEFTTSEEGIRTSRRIEVESLSDILELIAINPGIWRFGFRNRLANSSKFPATRMGEDQIYLLNILEKIESIFTFRENVYDYYSHQSGQLTKNKSAINDLIYGLFVSIEKFRVKKCFPLMIIVTRFTLTIVKKARFRLKVKVIVRIFLLLISAPREIPKFIHAVKLIWRLG